MPASSTIPLTSSDPGPPGRDGVNAFTFTSADVNAYDGVSTLTLPVQNTQWEVLNQAIEVAGVGTFQLNSIDIANSALVLAPKQLRGTAPYNIPAGTQVGPSGYPGPQGIQGAKGDKGDTGATGTPGTAATVAVGTTSTGAPGSNAAVTNAGTSAAAVLNFTIPRGDVGATGAQGPQGSTGPQGVPGANGGQGAQGVQGPKGDTGAAGAPGTPGVNSLATTSANGLLKQVSGLATDFVDGTNNCQDLATAVRPLLWSARLRGFNAIGNPNFEVDQRNVGNTVAAPVSGALIQDRWQFGKGGTMVCAAGRQNAGASEILVPGTNFVLSNNYLRVNLTTAQATLGAGDTLQIYTILEGTRFRELRNDVHSVSLLVRSSVPNLAFTLAVRDSAAVTKSLVKLCTIPLANTLTLISLPNLPLWPGGNFSSTPGNAGYQIAIVLACGSTYMAPAADTWQNGNFLGAPGMNNFAGNVVGSTFDIAFVQHEPGPVCSTLIDLPFEANYDACLRYFCKSYDYDVIYGTANAVGQVECYQNSTATLLNAIRFPKAMAKLPTVTAYNFVTGAANSVRMTNGSDYAVTAYNVGKGGFCGLNGTYPAVTAGVSGRFHYIADTGW
jgi:Collagen triple helix repeat (20 copies)